MRKELSFASQVLLHCLEAQSNSEMKSDGMSLRLENVIYQIVYTATNKSSIIQVIIFLWHNYKPRVGTAWACCAYVYA